MEERSRAVRGSVNPRSKVAPEPRSRTLSGLSPAVPPALRGLSYKSRWYREASFALGPVIRSRGVFISREGPAKRDFQHKRSVGYGKRTAQGL